MTTLKINLLGTVEISRVETGDVIKIEPAAQLLLAYLLLFCGKKHSRSRLAGLFWADSAEKQARRNLNTTLWRLRKRLEPDAMLKGTYLLADSADEIGFNNLSDYWLDVSIFENQLDKVIECSPHIGSGDAGLNDRCVQDLETSIEVYRGELMEGYYQDWILNERERLRRKYLAGLAWLMNHFRHLGHLDNALVWGNRLLAIDPVREDIHRAVMRLYEANGQRTEAIRQFDQCRQIINDELDIEPMPETWLQYEKLIADRTVFQAPGQPNGQESETYNLAVQQLNQTIQNFSEVTGQLQRAVQDLGYAINRLQ